MLICKTRGAFTIERGGPFNTAILARAGHRLAEPVICGKCAGECGVPGCPEPDYAESLVWQSIFRERTYETKILRKQFIDIATQWRGSHDLITTTVESTMSLEYDMKREPREPHDMEGLLQFFTRPWQNAAEFLNYRTKFDKWVKSGNTPRTVDDFKRFQQWTVRNHCGQHKGQQARTDFEEAVITMFAHGSCGLLPWDPKLRLGWSRRERAEILTGAGLPTTKRALEAHALKGLAPIEGSVSALTKRDEVLWAKLEPVIGAGPLLRLLAF